MNMKRFLTSWTVVIILAVCCICSASAESVTVRGSGELVWMLTEKAPFKDGTFLLDNDIILTNKSDLDLPLVIQSLVIDGQGHAFMPSPNYNYQNPIRVKMKDKGYLKLQNISDLGDLSVDYGNKGKVEFENVVLTGDYYSFADAQADLSSIRTAREYTKGRKQVGKINIRTLSSSRKAKLVLNKDCEIEKDWLVSAVNSELIINCDYYDAEVEAFANGSASFAGEGFGKGRLNVFMRGAGKINAKAQSEELKIVFSDSKSTKKQTVSASGEAHSVQIISHGLFKKNRSLSLNLSDVKEITFILDLTEEEIEYPGSVDVKENEELRKKVSQFAARVSLKKVKDADGQPVQSVTYRVEGRSAHGVRWHLDWDEAWNKK